jgi:hypothetical protein
MPPAVCVDRMVHATVGIRGPPPKRDGGAGGPWPGMDDSPKDRRRTRVNNGDLEGLAVQRSGVNWAHRPRPGHGGGHADRRLPDARADHVKRASSSSGKLGIDLEMHGHVAPMARFRDRAAQKRYTFYSILFKYREEEPLLDFTWSHGSIPPSRPNSLCSRVISPQPRNPDVAITKGFSPSPAEINLDSSARAVAETRQVQLHKNRDKSDLTTRRPADRPPGCHRCHPRHHRPP